MREADTIKERLARSRRNLPFQRLIREMLAKPMFAALAIEPLELKQLAWNELVKAAAEHEAAIHMDLQRQHSQAMGIETADWRRCKWETVLSGHHGKAEKHVKKIALEFDQMLAATIKNLEQQNIVFRTRHDNPKKFCFRVDQSRLWRKN